MKYRVLFLSALLLLGLLTGCRQRTQAQVAATTLPVYEFTSRLCEGTGITVTRLVTESVSCLHDYSLNVSQVQAVESARIVITSGAGLESFMDDLLEGKNCIDSSHGIHLLGCDDGHDHDHDHHHEADSHIWLSPSNAMIMVQNIYDGLCREFPEHISVFTQNLTTLTAELTALKAYGEAQLQQLACRDMVTFHDGFAYFADAFGLTILEAIEEESGSEASAQELISLIQLVDSHDLPAIFIESNGSVSAAEIIARETGVSVFDLDMAMTGDSYFQAMYHNIDTIKEAMG